MIFGLAYMCERWGTETRFPAPAPSLCPIGTPEDALPRRAHLNGVGGVAVSQCRPITNVGCYFLLDFGWLLLNLLSWLLDACYCFLKAPGCLLLSKLDHRSRPQHHTAQH